MIVKFMTALFSLLIFCIIGCGEDSSSILKPDTQPAMSPAVFEDVPAAPRMFSSNLLMCIEPVACVDLEWHELTQTQRNRKIIDRAYEDSGVDVGESCKEWVRTVIKEASDGHVVIPSNNESGDGWEPLDNHIITVDTCGSILNVRPGAIVQMQWAGVSGDHNRHTAIVSSVSANGITFIESNFDDTPAVNDGPENVQPRYISVEDFNAQVESFSVYYIR